MGLDRQLVFDDVATHLLTQNARSVYHEGGHICAYRGYDGKKCAIGALIPDHLYIPRFDTAVMTVRSSSAVRQAIDPKYGCVEAVLDTQFLGELQNVHDEARVTDWPHRLSAFAWKWDLNASVLTAPGESVLHRQQAE